LSDLLSCIDKKVGKETHPDDCLAFGIFGCTQGRRDIRPPCFISQARLPCLAPSGVPLHSAKNPSWQSQGDNPMSQDKEINIRCIAIKQKNPMLSQPVSIETAQVAPEGSRQPRSGA
jgi:hypothetical protein